MEVNKNSMNYLVNESGLREDVARVLVSVIPSQDFREYENIKRRLQQCCSTSQEYQQAINCLTNLMRI